jgi:hypothetical protein
VQNKEYIGCLKTREVLTYRKRRKEKEKIKEKEKEKRK